MLWIKLAPRNNKLYWHLQKGIVAKGREAVMFCGLDSILIVDSNAELKVNGASASMSHMDVAYAGDDQLSQQP